MTFSDLYRRAFRAAGLTTALSIALVGVACTEGDSSDDDTLTAAAALVLTQAANSSSACSGTGHCLMFATAVDATITTGVSGLDSACQSDANKPSGGGTYKAMVADATNRIACTTANCSAGTSEHTDWVLKPSKEYRRSDGTTVIGTTTANGVFTFPLTNSVQALAGSNATVTGLNTNWTSNGNDCTNFSTAATTFGLGLYDQTSNQLLNVGTTGCGSTGRRLVCVEQ